MDGDDVIAADEQVHLGGRQPFGVLAGDGGVGHQQQVSLEFVGLGTSLAVGRVLQREGVQAELVDQHGDLRRPRILHVHPDDVVGLEDVVVDLGGRHAALEAHAGQACHRLDAVRPVRRRPSTRALPLILGHPFLLAAAGDLSRPHIGPVTPPLRHPRLAELDEGRLEAADGLFERRPNPAPRSPQFCSRPSVSRRLRRLGRPPGPRSCPRTP